MEETLAQRPSSCLKIVLFGPESTGKTTLSRDLSRHFEVPLVPEFMREYLQEKWDRQGKVCEPKDLLPIARGQMKIENELAAQTRDLLICDTDLLELKVYSEVYYEGYCPPELLKHALNNQYDLYFLTYIDVPWIPDDLRDKPHDRVAMFEKFKAALDQHHKPYFILKGNREERFRIAVEKINQLKVNKSEI